MSFLRKIFSKSPSNPTERVTQFIDSDEPARALAALEEMGTLDPQLQVLKERASLMLIERNLLVARQAASSREATRASEHLELATTFICSDAHRQLIERESARVRELLNRPKEAPRVAAPTPEVSERDLTYDTLISELPDDIADIFAGQDSAFKDIVVDIASGKPSGAEKYFAGRPPAKDSGPMAMERGRFERERENYEVAAAAFAHAEQLMPTWTAPRLALADALWLAGKHDQAEDVLQRAVDKDDKNVEVYVAIARTGIIRGAQDYCLDAIEVGLELAPNDRRLLLLRGQYRELHSEFDAATADYEFVLQRTWRVTEAGTSFDVEAALLAAQLYRKLGQNATRAQLLFSSLLTVAPEHEKWRYALFLADVLLLDGKKSDAKQLLDMVGKVIPADERLARLRWADLSGERELFVETLGTLSPDERRAWDQAQAMRVRK